jgi:hypothetical protein
MYYTATYYIENYRSQASFDCQTIMCFLLTSLLPLAGSDREGCSFSGPQGRVALLGAIETLTLITYESRKASFSGLIIYES